MLFSGGYGVFGSFVLGFLQTSEEQEKTKKADGYLENESP